MFKSFDKQCTIAQVHVHFMAAKVEGILIIPNSLCL